MNPLPGSPEWTVELRRWFHRHPEPGFEERETQRKVLETLAALGIEARPVADTGVVADIAGARPGRTIALRADMDALRIREAETALNRACRSQNEGLMHACGHDGHMAMLLAAACALQARRAGLAGRVRLLFQPAEETPPGGAVRMLEAGCLEGADAVLGLHLLSTIPTGTFSFRAGPFMASCRTFRLRVTGRPGHHMCPQDNIDPLALAARFVATVQQDVRASLDPGQSYALGFGEFHSGTQHNQTPAEATLVGTLRTFDRAVSDRIVAAMNASLDGLVLAFARPGVEGLPSCRLELERGYPPLVNDARFAARAAQLLRSRFPALDDRAPLNFGSEDFARYLERVPGLFAFLGCGNPGLGITAVNHSDRFDLDERALAIGTDALVTLALDFLADPAAWLAPAAGTDRPGSSAITGRKPGEVR